MGPHGAGAIGRGRKSRQAQLEAKEARSADIVPQLFQPAASSKRACLFGASVAFPKWTRDSDAVGWRIVQRRCYRRTQSAPGTVPPDESTGVQDEIHAPLGVWREFLQWGVEVWG